MKFYSKMLDAALNCRSPCGERGLKYGGDPKQIGMAMSLPMRGAWIEIYRSILKYKALASRSPCGERGLKCKEWLMCLNLKDVAPHAGSVD